MVELYGRNWTREDLEARSGRMDQLAGIRRVRLSGGPGDGVELAEITTGTGFDFTVALSRGMDLYDARWQGRSLCWHSCTGMRAAAEYDPRGFEWLRIFFGGLLTTCGLTTVGWPSRDGQTDCGLHGRYTALAAEDVSTFVGWQDGEYHLTLGGTMREVNVHGEKLFLHRSIRARLGHPGLELVDTVENHGHRPVEHMILYHWNFGWPLMDSGTKLHAPSTARRLVAPGTPETGWQDFLPPTSGLSEHVYEHTMAADADGWVDLQLNNTEGWGAKLGYEAANLPRLTQWKMAGAGEYVLGLEPANCGVEGRAKARAAGQLVILAPGESRTYRQRFSVQ